MSPPDTVEYEDGTLVYGDEGKLMGEAYFYRDSVVVAGEGFGFSRTTDYKVVRIIFDDDGKIVKVETISDLPFKIIDKNTIYLNRGANISMIARYFKTSKEKILDCNPRIKNPNHIEAFTRLKIRCSND
jgi:hypothetical protein